MSRIDVTPEEARLIQKALQNYLEPNSVSSLKASLNEKLEMVFCTESREKYHTKLASVIQDIPGVAVCMNPDATAVPDFKFVLCQENLDLEKFRPQQFYDRYGDIKRYDLLGSPLHHNSIDTYTRQYMRITSLSYSRNPICSMNFTEFELQALMAMYTYYNNLRTGEFADGVIQEEQTAQIGGQVL